MRRMGAMLVCGVWCLALHVADAQAQSSGHAWPATEGERDERPRLPEEGLLSCAELLPGPLGPPSGTRTLVDTHESATVRVDGAGNLLFSFYNSVTESHRLELVRPDGSQVTSIYELPPPTFMIEQNQGFHLLGPRSDSDPTRVLHVLTSDGTLIPKPGSFEEVVDAVPQGGQGTVFLRTYRPSAARWRIETFVFDKNGEPSAAPLFIENGTGTNVPQARLGSSQAESALVLFDSSPTQNFRRWSARWFRPLGTAVGPTFVVADPLPYGAQMSPLPNGELGLRFGGSWLGRLAPFYKELLLAPPWLAAQPQLQVSPIRQGQGLGLFPFDVSNSCKNYLIVHTRSGEYCGEVAVPPAEPPCRYSDVRLTRDGTLIQSALIQDAQPGQDPMVRIRWWSGLLR